MKKGFTLAEVLITLGIIGVVAAMTLPTLINNSRYKELETGLKKNYSVIAQALDMYQAENGERVKAGEINIRELKSILLEYVKDSLDCGWGLKDDSCITNYTDDDLDSDVYKNYTGTKNINLYYFDDGQFILADGSLVLIENTSEVYSNGVLYISVDVNGMKKRPNRLGQDLFMFEIDEDGKLLPMGADGTNYYSESDSYCSSSSTNSMNGAGCTYKAFTEKDFFKNMPK